MSIPRKPSGNNENENVPNIDSIFQQMMRTAPERHRIFVETYREVMDDCVRLVGTRNDEDYNQMIALPDYFPFAEYSYAHMLYLKAMRAINQIMSGADPTDSLQDLINYTAFTAAWNTLRAEGRVPHIEYGPAAGEAQKRRSEMERELFGGGLPFSEEQDDEGTRGRVTEDTKLIGGPATGKRMPWETDPQYADRVDRRDAEEEANDQLRDEGAAQDDQEKF